MMDKVNNVLCIKEEKNTEWRTPPYGEEKHEQRDGKIAGLHRHMRLDKSK